ncbi:hypothetical protein AB0B45_33345 [Nonomuraea sp. NPDC049152]
MQDQLSISTAGRQGRLRGWAEVAALIEEMAAVAALPVEERLPRA